LDSSSSHSVIGYRGRHPPLPKAINELALSLQTRQTAFRTSRFRLGGQFARNTSILEFVGACLRLTR